MAEFSVKDKVALVTGGTAGIGFDFAKELLRNDIRGVCIVSSTAERGAKALKELLSLEFDMSRVLFVRTDVSVKEEYEAAIKKTIKQFKNLDIIVNSAGILDDKAYDKTVAVNINGTLYGCMLAWEYLPKYKSGSEGVVLNLSSITGLMSFRACPVYASSKVISWAFTRNFGHKDNYERTNVRFVAICPGIIWTPMIDNVNRDICISPHLKQFYDDDMELIKSRGQSCKATSTLMLDATKHAETGAIWSTDNNTVTKVVIPKLIDVPEVFA